MTYRIVIRDGHARFVYDDDLRALLDMGTPDVCRVSQVEPHPAGGWTADMALAGGPVLGPFATRRAALEAERAWLRMKEGL